MSATPNQIDAFIAGLSDDVLAECVRSVVATLPKLNDVGRAVLLRANPRRHYTLQKIIFAAFGPQPEPPAPKPHWNVSAPQDLEL